MPGIRQAIEHLSKLAETPTDQRHPLVSRALETDGPDMFTEYYGQLINLSRSGQAVMQVQTSYLYLRRHLIRFRLTGHRR